MYVRKKNEGAFMPDSYADFVGEIDCGLKQEFRFFFRNPEIFAEVGVTLRVCGRL